MYAGRSRSKSPKMMKRRRGSKSPMGKYRRGVVSGRGEYGFRQFLEDAAAPGIAAAGAVGGPVGAAMAGLAGYGIGEAERGGELAYDAFKQLALGAKGRMANQDEMVRYLNANPFKMYRGNRVNHANVTNPVSSSSVSDNTVRPAPVVGIRGAIGRGSYTPTLQLGGSSQSNSLIQGGRSPLQFGGTRDENGSLIVSFSEFVRDISAPASNAFTVTSYGLNPGLSESFPLLSQFAQNFEEYEFQQLIIEFRSAIDASSTTNASGNTGSIIMATNYNADADLFGDKEQMLLYSGGVEARVTENCFHGLECDRAKLSGGSTKFVRASALPIGDYKDYDKGVFQIAFNNIPSVFQGVQVGAIYAHYTVKLSKPKLFSALSNNVQCVRYYSTTGLSATNLVGTLCTALKSTIKGIAVTHEVVAATNGLRYTFPDNISGIFDIYCAFEGTTIVNGSYSVQVNTAASSRCTLWADMGVGSPYPAVGPSSNTFAQAPGTGMVKIRVKVTPCVVTGSNWVSWVTMASAATITGVYSEVTEVAQNFATSSTIPIPQFINAAGTIVAQP